MKKNNKSTNKNNKKIYIINMILVVMVFLVLLFFKKNYPFGKYELSFGDGLIQFKPMLYNFLYRLRHLDFSSYSFNNGLGSPTIFNYLYYNSSFVNLFAIFIKKPDNIYFFIIVLKLVITSITMTKYVTTKTNNNYYVIISVLSYSFCSCFLSYYFMLTFLDAFMVLPLLQYGLEKVLDRKSNKVYILSLAYLICCSFHFAFSICLYVLIYSLIVLFFYTKKPKLSVFCYLAKSTLISFVLCSFYLFALVDSFRRMGLVFDPFVNSYVVNYKHIFTGLFFGNFNITGIYDGFTIPNMAVNVIILINCLCFYFNKRIKRKDRIITFLSMIFIFICLRSQYINYIINGFHNIRGYPYRYAFIIVFLMIKMFLANVKNLKFDKSDKIKLVISSIIVLIVLFLLQKNDFVNNKTIPLSVSIIVSYFIYIIFYNKYKYYNLILLLLFMISIFVVDNNIGGEQKINNTIFRYNETNEKFRTSINTIISNKYKELKKIDNTNINLYTNDKVVDIFTSMSYSNVVYLLRDLGDLTYDSVSVKSLDSNYFSSMLFNKKQDYYLEKIYSVNKNIKDVKLNENMIIENVEKLANVLSNVKNVFDIKEVEGLNREGNKYYTNYYHFYTGMDYGIAKSRKAKEGLEFLLNGSSFYGDEEKWGKMVDVYYYNLDKINQIYQVLKKNQIKYDKYDDSHLKGTINVDKDQLIFTSIPYDTNWHIYLDGKRVKPIKILNSLIGIEAKEGKHTLEMKYSNNYLIIPGLVSIISFIFVIVKKSKDI